MKKKHSYIYIYVYTVYVYHSLVSITNIHLTLFTLGNLQNPPTSPPRLDTIKTQEEIQGYWPITWVEVHATVMKKWLEITAS